MQGTKRFKKVVRGEDNSFSPDDLNMEIKESTDVKGIFRKLSLTSAYCQSFGDKPAA